MYKTKIEKYFKQGEDEDGNFLKESTSGSPIKDN